MQWRHFPWHRSYFECRSFACCANKPLCIFFHAVVTGPLWRRGSCFWHGKPTLGYRVATALPRSRFNIKLSREYHQFSNTSRTIVGNEIVDHSDVVGASPVGTAPTTPSFLPKYLASVDWVETTATRRQTFKFWDLVRLILEIWWYVCLHYDGKISDSYSQWSYCSLILLSFQYYQCQTGTSQVC